MKINNNIILTFLLGCFSGLFAQEAYEQPVPSDGNYVLSRTYQERPLSDSGQIQYAADVVESIQYFDGLGRNQQTIGIGHSPNGEDLVTPFSYDEYGRMPKEWLAIPAPGNDIRGDYHPGSQLDVQQYYFLQYGADFSVSSSTESNPYSEKLYDKSPLNRVLKQGAPGSTWALDPTGDDHSIGFLYETNVTGEVRRFDVSLSGTLPALLMDESGPEEYYTAHSLMKSVTRDENHVSGKNHTVEEFTDKLGRVLLKRTYADTDITGDGNPESEVAHDTYYVYDDFGNLTFVLPPKLDAGSTNLSSIQGLLDDLGYRYKYDHRNRLIEKKLPGKGWEFIVYNELDQPIMTQDVIQRNTDEWLFTKYDVFGRVAYTGKATIAGTRSDVQGYAVTFDATHDPWATTSYSGVTLVSGDDPLFYLDGGYPNSGITEILTVNYYDDYRFASSQSTAPGSVTLLGSSPVESNAENVRGLATGSRVRVLDTGASQAMRWITTLTYYDEKGRPIYTHTDNPYLGTVDHVETQLDFGGKPLKVRTAHIRDAITRVTLDTYTYDHVGRLLTQTQCLGDETMYDTCTSSTVPAHLPISGTISNEQVATQSITVTSASLVPGAQLYIDPNATGSGTEIEQELIVLIDYDELGQLQYKKVGGTANTTDILASAGLQQVDYSYNVRGWLKGINDPTNLGDQLFAFAINYNTQDHGSAALFNGNISETEWKTANDGILRWYAYDYDPLNRITGGWSTSNSNYNVSNISYDRNGNIQTLNRKGHTALDGNGQVTGYGDMDILNYDYDNGNQLTKITDTGHQTFGFADGVDQTIEYTYDDNGNMKTDANKGITAITYNYLNLPTQIEINSGSIVYIYDATGVKLRKITEDGSMTTTDYAGNYIYENGTLQFFSHPEGYVNLTGGSGPEYVYQYKDHLGNIRLSYSDTDGSGTITVSTDPMVTEIVEENNYYPFGLEHKGYNNVVNGTEHKYKFNNKELQEELGLNMYDFGARMLDPALGRWFNIDPLAENNLDLNPYHFVANNPLIFVDPDGMDWFYYRKEGEEEASWNWQDGSEYEHSYTYTDDDGNKQTESITLQGVKAVVVFDGTGGESIGGDGTMTGEGANPANVTVYGPGGADDVQTYRGISTTSDPSKYSMIAEGDYEGFWQQMGSSPFGKNALTYRIQQLDGNKNIPTQGNETNKAHPENGEFMTQIFLHRTNWSGKASGRVSEGCLIIDARQWRKVEGQLGKINSFLIQVRRTPNQRSKNSVSTVTTPPPVDSSLQGRKNND